MRKSSKMRNYLIFSILTIYMIFGIGLFSAKALTTENGEFPNIPNDGFDNFVLVEADTNIFNLYTFNGETNLDFKFTENTSSLSIMKGNPATSTVDYRRYRLVDGKWQYWNNEGQYSFPCIKIVATTYLIHQLEGANWVPTYFPGYGLEQPGIELTKGAACDLNGTDFYLIEADFSKVVDTSLTFQVKIGNNDWQDITSQILDSETYDYKYSYEAYWNTEFKARVLYSDGTVKTENTISVTELTSYEDFIKPKISINVYNITPGDSIFPVSRININFSKIDRTFRYQYSFNNKDWLEISYNDLENKSYDIDTLLTGTIYVRILNLNNDLISSESAYIATQVEEGFFTYEIPLSDFYDSENNKLKYLAIFFEHSKEEVYYGFKLVGDKSKEMPFSINYSTNIIDIQRFVQNIDFSSCSYRPLPYEFFYKNNKINSSYSYHNAFVVVPYINVEEEDFTTYTSEKLIIKSSVEINLDFIQVAGAIIPTFDNISNIDKSGHISDVILSIFDPIMKKLPIVDQIKTLIDSYSYNYDGGTGVLPEFKVNFSFLGIDKEQNIIDFSYFLEYRDILFSFEKLFLAFYTLMAVIKTAENAVHGGGS